MAGWRRLCSISTSFDRKTTVVATVVAVAIAIRTDAVVEVGGVIHHRSAADGADATSTNRQSQQAAGDRAVVVVESRSPRGGRGCGVGR